MSVADVATNPDDAWAWIGLAADVIDLVPFVTGMGEVVRVAKVSNKAIDAVDTVSDATKVAKKTTSVGWKVGDDITNLTKAGKSPSWTTVRSRYWKNEAHNNPTLYLKNDLFRMSKGRAPIGNDAFPMELHHPYGRKGQNFFVFEPLTRTEHRRIHYG